jgi:hypothetical protein
MWKKVENVLYWLIVVLAGVLVVCGANRPEIAALWRHAAMP